MGVLTRDMTDDLDGINTQARDISFLITYAKTLPDADLSTVAVVSWSWGGISSLFAAARDSRIDALVSMDGSMRYYPGLVIMAGDVHPEQITIPLLFFTRGDPNLLEDIERNYDGPPAYVAGPNVLKRLDTLRCLHREYARHGTLRVQLDVSTQGERAALCRKPGSRLRTGRRQHECRCRKSNLSICARYRTEVLSKLRA